MGKQTLHIERLWVDSTPAPGVVHGGVLVLDDTGSAWHAHAATTQPAEWRSAEEYELRIATMEGLELSGRATVERTDGKAHYFVGAGQLDGLA
jgi:hypothetical protein